MIRLLAQTALGFYSDWCGPMGSIVVPFYGLYLGSYKVIPKRNYYGAYVEASYAPGADFVRCSSRSGAGVKTGQTRSELLLNPKNTAPFDFRVYVRGCK